MTIGQVYLTFLQLVNRGITNDNVDVDKSRFVLLFNNIQNRFVEWTLEKRNEDDIRDVQELLTLDKSLAKTGDVLNHSNFKLPEDYFDHSSLQVFASGGSCKNVRLTTFETKNDDVEELISDCNNEPSLKYTETFYTINNNTVSVYFKDFKIDKVYLSYYRYPTQIDIEGYENLDCKPSKNIDPEFTDRIIYKILLAMVKEYNAINDETGAYQISSDRLFKEI